VSRRDLPEEFSGPLDFAQLLETLDALDGERIGVELLKSDGPELGSSVAIAGTLRRLGQRGLTRGWFAVGDGARLALFETDYRTTHLLTYDGNDGFQLVIELQQGTVIIGDVMITAVDATMPEVE
jgi:hypothetical protein